ncbi:MAG: competence/damage-inducible protein A, partial [Pyrinomonadaceae bacterium]|nr:competence/damage-inducible protein A [Pyrinomonadaceae bacterium]
IIAIGSELLTPEKTDTNSLWLTEKLNEIGIEVKLKTVVGDDANRLEETIKDAFKRSNVVITTGGLGPTEDDISRQIAAKAVGRSLVFNEEIAQGINDKFLKVMKREMPEINRRQAFIIEGAEILTNPNGTAPGMMLVEKDGDEYKFLVVLPGPPREMKPMFEKSVLPRLKEKAGEISVRRRVLRVGGMGESALDTAIAPIYKQYENPLTSILFNRSEIEVQLTANARTEAEAESLLDEVSAKIVEKLGTSVFATHGEIMEEIIAKLLTENGKTVAVAESCTGGLISQRLTDIAGSSAYFIEAVIAYANESKIRNLNVSQDLINKHGAVSAEVAAAMANGIREKAGTDYAISVTGIAGPEGGTPEKPVGLVFIAVADETGAETRQLNLPGDRYLIRWRSSQAALDLLRRKLLSQNPNV